MSDPESARILVGLEMLIDNAEGAGPGRVHRLDLTATCAEAAIRAIQHAVKRLMPGLYGEAEPAVQLKSWVRPEREAVGR